MYERIIVGTDGSETASKAVETAATIAGGCGARLVVGVAYSGRLTSQERADLEAAPEQDRWRLLPGPAAEGVAHQAAVIAQRTADTPIDVDIHCLIARPVDAIVGLAEDLDADLVVVGNRGMSGAGRVFGSVARAVSHRSPCDVLVVDTVGRRHRRSRRFRPAA